MDSSRCLAWCHEYGRTMQDRITAKHVRDWIASKASTVATTTEDHIAIFEASAQAARVLADPPYYDRPCAAEGLTSYRYRHRRQWVMIGARDIGEALREAARSIEPAQPLVQFLQVWNGEAYANVI